MSVNIRNPITGELTNASGGVINPKSINEMIAPIEDGTASKAYVVGEQFIMNDLLCEATQAIAQGDTMVIGTNCEESEQLSKQVKDIKSALYKGSVSVTGDGAETMAQLITRLEALVDFDKVNEKSYIKYGGMVLLPNNFTSNEVRFTSVGISGTTLYVRTMFVGTHGYMQSVNGGTATDQSSTTASSGIKLELIY